MPSRSVGPGTWAGLGWDVPVRREMPVPGGNVPGRFHSTPLNQSSGSRCRQGPLPGWRWRQRPTQTGRHAHRWHSHGVPRKLWCLHSDTGSPRRGCVAGWGFQRCWKGRLRVLGPRTHHGSTADLVGVTVRPHVPHPFNGPGPSSCGFLLSLEP